MFPFLLPGVLAESAGIRKKQFNVTDKSGRTGWRLWYTLPFIALIALSVLGTVNTVNRMISEQTTVYLFLLFWLTVNLYELLYALTFVLCCSRLPQQSEQKIRQRRLSDKLGLRTSLLYILIKTFKTKEKKEVT